MGVDLLAHFPRGFTPRAEQERLLVELGDAIGEKLDDPTAPRVLAVEAPPGVGKSHVAMTVARWSGSAYLLTSQKLLQEQYEREFGRDVQLVKGRDNYLCERYVGTPVTASHGLCRRRGAPPCQCPYARAKAAAVAGPIFCTNTAYFLTLRQWQPDVVTPRRVLIVDEAHNLETQLVGVFTVRFSPDQMTAWFGAALPRLPSADDYRDVMSSHLDRLERELAEVDEALGSLGVDAGEPDAILRMPPSPREQNLLTTRDGLANALARIGFFVDACDQEWVVRHGEDAALELVPLTVVPMAHELLFGAADIVVLTSAFLGQRAALADSFGLATAQVRAFRSDSPFPLERRPIVYRPVGALSKDTLPMLEPALFDAVGAILGAHERDKGLIHVASYASGERLVQHLAQHAPAAHRRVIWASSAAVKPHALEHHRASPLPTVLLSPSLREGVDLPDDYLRFQVLTKMPYPDLGDPWTATRCARDPRWYALETAKALVQAYGRSCRHADDRGVTYMLDGQFTRFLTRYRPLMPSWFLDAAHEAILAWKRSGG